MTGSNAPAPQASILGQETEGSMMDGKGMKTMDQDGINDVKENKTLTAKPQ